MDIKESADIVIQLHLLNDLIDKGSFFISNDKHETNLVGRILFWLEEQLKKCDGCTVVYKHANSEEEIDVRSEESVQEVLDISTVGTAIHLFVKPILDDDYEIINSDDFEADSIIHNLYNMNTDEKEQASENTAQVETLSGKETIETSLNIVEQVLPITNPNINSVKLSSVDIQSKPPVASDSKASHSNSTVNNAREASQEMDVETKLSTLQAMGFTDRKMNQYVLTQCKNDMSLAIDWLFTNQAVQLEVPKNE